MYIILSCCCRCLLLSFFGFTSLRARSLTLCSFSSSFPPLHTVSRARLILQMFLFSIFYNFTSKWRLRTQVSNDHILVPLHRGAHADTDTRRQTGRLKFGSCCLCSSVISCRILAVVVRVPTHMPYLAFTLTRIVKSLSHLIRI